MEAFARTGARPGVEPVLPQRPAPVAVSVAGLSSREIEVAVLVAQGLSNKEIGQALAISYHTVSTHLRRVFGKLGMNSRIELCRFVLAGSRRLPEAMARRRQLHGRREA